MNHSEAMAEIRSGRIRPVYLIYGGEPFLEAELCRTIRAAVVQPETADFNFHVVDTAADQLQQALSLAQTQPFFAERRLVLVRGCPVFSASRKQTEVSETDEERPAGSEEALLAYLKQPVATTCLVFVAGSSVDSRKKVTKALISAGGLVECKPLRETDAIMWAQRAATAHGKKLGDAAARVLLDKTTRLMDDNKTAADLALIDSELQKLALYVGEAAEITAADVSAAVGGIAETEIFRLTEAVMLRQRARALQLLAMTLRQVDHPLQVLAALANRYRQMLTVKALVTRGASLREGPGIAKMHPFAYEKMVGHVRPYSREELAAALEKLLEADVAMKSGSDATLALEMLVVELMA